MILNKKIFRYLKGDHTYLEKEPLERLSNKGQLYAFKHEGFWQCMDTLRDKEILEKSKYHENINIIPRSKELSGDNALTIDVAKDLIKNQKLDNNDILLLFQPTSPFRDIKEICKAINHLISEKKWQSVVSLTSVNSYHPFRMKRLTNDMECIDFIDQGFEDMRPRQSLTKVYIRSGNFYIAYIKSLMELNTMLPKPTKGIIHNEPNCSLNIDNVNDLYLAESIALKTSL